MHGFLELYRCGIFVKIHNLKASVKSFPPLFLSHQSLLKIFFYFALGNCDIQSGPTIQGKMRQNEMNSD
jgi:hypothetical protein